ncbi:hypothetical protein SAM19_03896 [Brevibacillus laterosporus]|nr:hypothetical protein [Brevibacillus laterosporus]
MQYKCSFYISFSVITNIQLKKFEPILFIKNTIYNLSLNEVRPVHPVGLRKYVFHSL